MLVTKLANNIGTLRPKNNRAPDTKTPQKQLGPLQKNPVEDEDLNRLRSPISSPCLINEQRGTLSSVGVDFTTMCQQCGIKEVPASWAVQFGVFDEN